MGLKRITLVAIFVALLFAPLVVRGNDVDDLKASFEQTITAYNTRDLDALVVGQRDHLMYFGPFAPSSDIAGGRAPYIGSSLWSRRSLER